MSIEIRETVVIPDSSGSTVRLQISDKPLHSESAPTFYLNLTVKLPEYTAPLLLAQLQTEALRKITGVVKALDQELLREIVKLPIQAEPMERIRPTRAI
jgi:hypothetical protein